MKEQIDSEYKNDNDNLELNNSKKITDVMGWVCPLCQVVNAPWIANCNCKNKKNKYITTEY